MRAMILIEDAHTITRINSTVEAVANYVEMNKEVCSPMNIVLAVIARFAFNCHRHTAKIGKARVSSWTQILTLCHHTSILCIKVV